MRLVNAGLHLYTEPKMGTFILSIICVVCMCVRVCDLWAQSTAIQSNTIQFNPIAIHSMVIHDSVSLPLQSIKFASVLVSLSLAHFCTKSHSHSKRKNGIHIVENSKWKDLQWKNKRINERTSHDSTIELIFYQTIFTISRPFVRMFVCFIQCKHQQQKTHHQKIEDTLVES